jgi:hypothetical protein
MKNVLQNRTISVKLNNSVGPYFISHKGVRHGDPLSPLLFNIVAGVLTRMMLSAQQNNLIIGLVDNLVPKALLFCNMQMTP